MKVKIFKAGQVVEYVGAGVAGPDNWFKIGTRFNVVEECKKPAHWICEKLQEVEPNYLNLFYSSEFEIVKDIQEFDMKKEKWFISFNDSNEFYAIKDWFLKNGWFVSNSLTYKLIGSNKNFTNTTFDGNQTIDTLMWAEKPHSSAKEIKINFKTIVDSVEYPVIETEQQKQIRELEETIAKAAEQIKSLKGEK